MKNKIFKKLDIIIIIVLLVVSFIPYLLLKGINKDVPLTEEKYAVVTVAGKEIEKIQLTSGLEDVYELKTTYGYNKIEIHDGKIGIAEADCSDEVCVYQGYISKVGDQIVCLPHRLIITIEGNDTEEGNEDIISR